MADPKIQIVGSQRYGCIRCGKCCRRFHVAISQAEIDRLSALDWGDDSCVPETFANWIGGHAYFQRTPDGGCVFLDADSGECRMHRRFGYAAKALSCRGYPLNISSTYWGEVSVLARMDCPAVALNEGVLLTDDREAIEAVVRELGPRGGFSNEELLGLPRGSVACIQQTFLEIVRESADGSPGDLVCKLAAVLMHMEKLGHSFLKDTPTLKEVLPSIRRKAGGAGTVRPDRCLGAFSRALFRQWWASCCRRDEEIVSPGPRLRLRRMFALLSLLFGRGSLRPLGLEHPDIALSEVNLLSGKRDEASAPENWECYRRFLISRLETLQFFGASYYHADIFQGLRALFLTYPLVLASARVHAVAKNHRCVIAEDVRYAVGAIDHSHGRSPLLQAKIWRTVENYFWGERFQALLLSLGWE